MSDIFTVIKIRHRGFAIWVRKDLSPSAEIAARWASAVEAHFTHARAA
jgi:hypothetical protein